MALLVSEADKMNMEQELTVWVPHLVWTLMESKGQLMLRGSNIRGCYVKTCTFTINPVTLLPFGPGQPDHDCGEVMDGVFSSQPDLTDKPLKGPEAEYFTEGSSFVK